MSHAANKGQGANPPTASGAPAGAAHDESALLARLRAGEEAAFEEVVRAHAGHMLAVARRFFPGDDDANDAVQDAFLSAFRSIQKFEGGSKISTWLHRITVNASLMKLRGRSRRPEKSIEDLLPRFEDDGHRANVLPAWREPKEGAMERAELRALVRRRIDELPDDYRTVLVLRDIEGLDTESAAEALGITTAAVKTRLHRARQALRELLDPDLSGGR